MKRYMMFDGVLYFQHVADAGDPVWGFDSPQRAVVAYIKETEAGILRAQEALDANTRYLLAAWSMLASRDMERAATVRAEMSEVGRRLVAGAHTPAEAGNRERGTRDAEEAESKSA